MGGRILFCILNSFLSFFLPIVSVYFSPSVQRFQVRRLSSHPSVLIYAGNNENEKALRHDWYGTGGNFSLYYRDYVTLYAKTVRRVVTREDPTRPFVTSSPSNGVESEREGWVAENPSDPLYGDLHPYRYVEDGWDYRSYPVGRYTHCVYDL